MTEEHRKSQTALPLIMAIGALALGASTSVKAEPKSELIATLPALVAAAHEACDLDTLRSDSTWRLHGEFKLLAQQVDDKTNSRNEDWLKRYNRFANSENARTLEQYAAALSVSANSGTRLSDAECQIVIPAYGVAATATALGVKPDDIVDGPLTSSCEGGKCVTDNLKKAASLCETTFRSKRYVEWCHTASGKPITYGEVSTSGEVSETPSSNADKF